MAPEGAGGEEVVVNSPSSLETLLKNGPLTEAQAVEIFQQGQEAVVFALLTLSAKALKEDSPAPSTPSGMIPPYQKPNRSARKKRPGRKKGHPGSRRAAPLTIDQTITHPLTHCPDCGSVVAKSCETRTRTTEDIPTGITPVVVQHIIERGYCSTCRKIVEAPVPEALPKATIGNHLLALSAWFHFGLGQTISQIVAVLSCHLHFALTPGGLVQMWHRLAAILYAWYEAIGEQAKNSHFLHADETGWRVMGKTFWLWCFTNDRVTYYLIDHCRGSPVLKRFFSDAFSGTLIADFWGAYNRLKVAARQVCFVHLFRELENVLLYKDPSGDWRVFYKKLRRLLRDSLRLRKKDGVSPEEFASAKKRFLSRLDEILKASWQNKNAQRLVKRLRRHRNDLFTFLDHPDVPADNNHGEREIRPAVIIRKNILCNRSEQGAHTQAILMSVYRTLKLRGHDPIKTIAQALATYINTGTLPPLPE